MEDPATCVSCGRYEQERPVSWSLQVGERGQTWLCDVCTRQNLRSIEGRLDEAWW
ncbi:MAG: hypothetical protein JWO60_2018 [Frankiales bacterium]|nr:hypothetical protein [Frankiales bacterium]